VYYDANLKRVYMTGGRWYGTPEASPGWIYVYQQKDPDHYDVISKIKTRPGSGTSLLVPQLNMSHLRQSVIKTPRYWYSRPRNESSFVGAAPIFTRGVQSMAAVKWTLTLALI
jgi:hypothetical protein